MLPDISKTISYISRGVELNQPRLIQRAIRQVCYHLFFRIIFFLSNSYGAQMKKLLAFSRMM